MRAELCRQVGDVVLHGGRRLALFAHGERVLACVVVSDVLVLPLEPVVDAVLTFDGLLDELEQAAKQPHLLRGVAALEQVELWRHGDCELVLALKQPSEGSSCALDVLNVLWGRVA